MVDCICVGSNIVTVLANCVDVVLVGVVVVVVQVVVHVGHQVEHEKGEGHKVKGVEAIVALSSRTTWADQIGLKHFSRKKNSSMKIPHIQFLDKEFSFVVRAEKNKRL